MKNFITPIFLPTVKSSDIFYQECYALSQQQCFCKRLYDTKSCYENVAYRRNTNHTIHTCNQLSDQLEGEIFSANIVIFLFFRKSAPSYFFFYYHFGWSPPPVRARQSTYLGLHFDHRRQSAQKWLPSPSSIFLPSMRSNKFCSLLLSGGWPFFPCHSTISHPCL